MIFAYLELNSQISHNVNLDRVLALFRRKMFGLQSLDADGELMSFMREALRSIYAKLFPEESRRVFSEEPTRPLDAATLAQALVGEGRSHAEIGYAKYVPESKPQSTEQVYVLSGNSDGLKVQPDFGIYAICESPGVDEKNVLASEMAMSEFINQILRSALLDIFMLEEELETTPITDIVLNAFKTTAAAVNGIAPDIEYSLTAGLIFSGTVILGTRGMTKAFQVDRHHLEELSASAGIEEKQDRWVGTSINVPDAEDSQFQTTIITRPVPRDGNILMCTQGIWRNLLEKEISEIVMGSNGPQEGCEKLITRCFNKNPGAEASVILIYFPPDFGV